MHLSHRELAKGGANFLGAGDVGVHAPNVPEAVRFAQPHPVRLSGYRIRVALVDPRTFLWANICALMRNKEPSLDAVVEATGVGRGTVQRIRDGEAATRLTSLNAIAEAFDIEVWQLLVPGLDPDHLPRVVAPGSVEERLARLEAASSPFATPEKPQRQGVR